MIEGYNFLKHFADCNFVWDVIWLIRNELIDFWQKQKIRTSDELSAILESFSINFFYHSGKISNDNVAYNDVCEIFKKDGIKSYTGDMRTLFEIRNSKNAYEYMLFSFGQKSPVTEEFVKLVQNILTANTYDARYTALGEHPGTYRHNNYINGEIDSSISVGEIHVQISELIESVFANNGFNPLVTAADFLVKFENIHPFFDGNGRTSRFLINYFLLLNDYPPIVIHEDDRKEFYEALERCSSSNKIDFLIVFLDKQLKKTWNDIYSSLG